MKKFNFKQVTEYLDDCLVFGIKPDLARIKKILEITGEPQKKCDFIHVVGTNGKTSTTIMTANILKGHGLRCGYHISPHINYYTERIWIDGSDISRQDFEDIFNFIYPYIEKINSFNLGGPMTQFEIIAAMAFTAAADKKLDVMVLEAGMGGRWDATNAADSRVAGLTGVSLEHTSILGKTIGKIAAEKVEVIKKGATVATLSRDKKVLEVLQNKTVSTGSKLYLYGKDFCIINKIRDCFKGWSTDIKGTAATYRDIVIPLTGNYQPFNLALSVVLSELYLSTLGRSVDGNLLKESLKDLKISGRFQFIKKAPPVIADASHNPEGIRNFVKNIMECFNDCRKIVIFSVLKDKDYKKMISLILKISDILILTSSNTERSLSPGELECELKKTIELKKQVEGGNEKNKKGAYAVDIDRTRNKIEETDKNKKNNLSCSKKSLPLKEVYKIDNITNSL
ncbi:MAG: hypothetical protein FJW61_06060, partial [Actinobacteria bacterium]|nr:hypothetical protein [Actinomycetota bacterium]